MRHTKLALATMAMAVLAACGGTSPSPGNQTPKIKYTAQVTFGDSLSDVGSYAVGTVKALGGGKFTINGDNTAVNPALTGKNYTELLAAQMGLPAPCAAVTGLNGVASLGFAVPVVAHSGCYGYAQGGSRVTNPVGPGNAAAPSLNADNTVSAGSPLGALTVPLVTQVANHLAAVGGKFTGTEMVIVMGGGNDVLEQLNELAVNAATAGNTAGAAAGATAGNNAFGASLVGQLAAGATNPQTAAQAIGTALATAAASGADQATIVGAAVTAAAQQPGDSAVASPAVYGPMVAKATADGQAAGASAGAAAGLAAANAYAATNGPTLVANMAAAGPVAAGLDPVAYRRHGDGLQQHPVDRLRQRRQGAAGRRLRRQPRPDRQ